MREATSTEFGGFEELLHDDDSGHFGFNDCSFPSQVIPSSYKNSTKLSSMMGMSNSFHRSGFPFKNEDSL